MRLFGISAPPFICNIVFKRINDTIKSLQMIFTQEQFQQLFSIYQSCSSWTKLKHKVIYHYIELVGQIIRCIDRPVFQETIGGHIVRCLFHYIISHYLFSL